MISLASGNRKAERFFLLEKPRAGAATEPNVGKARVVADSNNVL